MAASYSHTGIWLVLGILILRVLIKAPHLFNAWWASALLTGIPVCVNQKQIWPSLPPSVENSHPLSEEGDLLGSRNKTKVGIQVETSFEDFQCKVIFGETLHCYLVFWSLGLPYTSLEYSAPHMTRCMVIWSKLASWIYSGITLDIKVFSLWRTS